MRSIKFPKMFNTSNTRVWQQNEHHEATLQNTALTIFSERGELFGDPYFGVLFKHFLFEQNSGVMRDHLIDMIYTQLALMVPQLRVERKNISIIRDRNKGKLYCTIQAVNQIDFTPTSVTLLLFDADKDSR